MMIAIVFLIALNCATYCSMYHNLICCAFLAFILHTFYIACDAPMHRKFTQLLNVINIFVDLVSECVYVCVFLDGMNHFNRL